MAFLLSRLCVPYMVETAGCGAIVNISSRTIKRVPKTQLQLPSIGSERKTYFPHRRRFFDPGVCSRSGWAVSSGDFVLVIPLEQLRNRYERLGLTSRFEGNLIASRFVGVCALHGNVGTILPSGPLPAIASLGSSEGHSLSFGP